MLLIIIKATSAMMNEIQPILPLISAAGTATAKFIVRLPHGANTPMPAKTNNEERKYIYNDTRSFIGISFLSIYLFIIFFYFFIFAKSTTFWCMHYYFFPVSLYNQLIRQPHALLQPRRSTQGQKNTWCDLERES